MLKKWYYRLLNILALLLPLYLVYYWPLHDKPYDPYIRTLWIYTVVGLVLYLIITGAIILHRL